MNRLQFGILRAATFAFGLALVISSTAADTEPAATMSAGDLAAHLRALQDGSSYVRLRLEVKQPIDTTKTTLQLQIKQRRTGKTTDLVYQVLWPKERKGEAVLLHKADGNPPTGSIYIPSEKPRPLNASQMSGALYGSDLSYADVIENFFGWANQTIAGAEVLNGTNCLILESRPDKGDFSRYSRVRSWIDSRRLVPLRVEKYLPSGQMARRIETLRVVTDDKGHLIPGDLTVRGPEEDSVTNLDGSRIRHDVTYTDREFTTEGLTDALASPSAHE